MKKKQTLAVLLAAAMVLSMPVGAYAEELDGEENSAGLVEPYVVDVTAPTINRISADKTELKAGETTKIRIEADDDVSGIRTFIASFQKEGTEDYISTAFSLNENPCEAELEISPYLPSGNYTLSDIQVIDKAGNSRYYSQYPTEGGPEALPNSLTLVVTNEGKQDIIPPTISKISIDKTQLKAGETTKVRIEADDDVSGIRTFIASFQKEGTEDYVSTGFSLNENPCEAELEISPYLPSGNYILTDIQVIDKAGNSKYYSQHPTEGGSEALPNSLTLVVTNEGRQDVTPPTISKISIDKTELKAGETTKVRIEADDDVSGIRTFIASFRKEGTENYVSTEFSLNENPCEAELELSPYLPSGNYMLTDIQVIDKAGNSRYYDINPVEDYTEKLPNSISFTVINDDPVTPPPTDPETPSNPSNPTTPSRPNSSTTTVPGTPIDYESEKPDPADEQAVEAYNFWQNTKREIRVYERAGSLRVYVPADVTYMPASVMETLRVENVPVVLQWQGHRIEIPAGKAQPKQPLKAYWPMKTLCELYNA